MSILQPTHLDPTAQMSRTEIKLQKMERGTLRKGMETTKQPNRDSETLTQEETITPNESISESNESIHMKEIKTMEEKQEHCCIL